MSSSGHKSILYHPFHVPPQVTRHAPSTTSLSAFPVSSFPPCRALRPRNISAPYPPIPARLFLPLSRTRHFPPSDPPGDVSRRPPSPLTTEECACLPTTRNTQAGAAALLTRRTGLRNSFTVIELLNSLRPLQFRTPSLVVIFTNYSLTIKNNFQYFTKSALGKNGFLLCCDVKPVCNRRKTKETRS